MLNTANSASDDKVEALSKTMLGHHSIQSGNSTGSATMNAKINQAGGVMFKPTHCKAFSYLLGIATTRLSVSDSAISHQSKATAYDKR